MLISLQFLLERKSRSTWRLGLPKRIMYHNMSVPERLQFHSVSANAFGVHRAPKMKEFVIGYSLLMRDPVRNSASTLCAHSPPRLQRRTCWLTWS